MAGAATNGNRTNIYLLTLPEPADERNPERARKTATIHRHFPRLSCWGIRHERPDRLPLRKQKSCDAEINLADDFQWRPGARGQYVRSGGGQDLGLFGIFCG